MAIFHCYVSSPEGRSFWAEAKKKVPQNWARISDLICFGPAKSDVRHTQVEHSSAVSHVKSQTTFATCAGQWKHPSFLSLRSCQATPLKLSAESKEFQRLKFARWLSFTNFGISVKDMFCITSQKLVLQWSYRCGSSRWRPWEGTVLRCEAYPLVI